MPFPALSGLSNRSIVAARVSKYEYTDCLQYGQLKIYYQAHINVNINTKRPISTYYHMLVNNGDVSSRSKPSRNEGTSKNAFVHHNW
jgi:hypothetical protein